MKHPVVFLSLLLLGQFLAVFLACLSFYLKSNKNHMAVEKEIMYESEEAATYRTGLEGWVSAAGHFFGKSERAQHMARYDGCTHHISDCGHKANRGWSMCEECLAKKRKDNYLQMPEIEWDGSTPLCLYQDDKYFFDEDDIIMFCEDDDIDPSSLQLCICEPNYYQQVTSEAIAPEDVAPEDYDGYLPKEIQAALDMLNEAIEKYDKPFAWSQGIKRVTVHIEKDSSQS